ncbi:hypothetical protein [Pollutibacter soli]|uniref:hypothetical protein n=1 Tax=Pollutibacter soli TaxID=3034157 RepID=UPI003013C917
MVNNEIQQKLFSHIKSFLPVHLSLTDEISSLLNIGNDSAYRRIRGETELSFSELQKLCNHFKLSLDQILQLKNDSVVFTANELNYDKIDFNSYINGLLNQLKYFNSFRERKMLYLSKDAPIFHFYLFPAMAAFKSFFWSRSILNDPVFSQRKFSMDDAESAEYYKFGLQILREYNEIPSMELWNYESINSTISQIEYYRTAGVFATRNDLVRVVESLIEMLEHLQQQAEKGQKFLPGGTDLSYRAPFQFFINELIIGNNTIMVQLDQTKIVFISYNILHTMHTSDTRFTEKAFKNFDMLASRAIMISGTGERDRSKFFQQLKDKAYQCLHN